MSRKHWFPQSKLHGPREPLRPLPKVRIKGVDTRSALGQRLLNALAGRIGQFHRAQAQKYMLGSVPNQRGYLDHPDVKMRYTNLQGQEIIDIVVDPAVIEKLETGHGAVLISFQYEDMWGLGASHAAYVHVPTPNRTDDYHIGMALESSATSDFTRLPLISYPPHVGSHARYSTPIPIVPDGRQRSTLLIDPTAIHGMPVIIVDVYGEIIIQSPWGKTCEITRWDAGSTGVLLSQTSTPYHTWLTLMGGVEPFHGPPYDLIYPESYYIPPEAAPEDENWAVLPLPDTINTYDPFPPEDSFDVDEVPPEWDGVINQYTLSHWEERLDDVRQSAPGGDPSETWAYSQMQRGTTESFSASYYNPVGMWAGSPTADKTAEVTAAFLGWNPQLNISKTFGTHFVDGGACSDTNFMQDFKCWEERGRAPGDPSVHLRLGTIENSSVIPGFPYTQANHYGQKFLCRITYDLRIGALTLSTTPPA